MNSEPRTASRKHKCSYYLEVLAIADVYQQFKAGFVIQVPIRKADVQRVVSYGLLMDEVRGIGLSCTA